MQYDIKFEGLSEQIERADAAGANVEPLLQAGLYRAGLVVQRQARAQAPHRTGNLQRSILVEPSAHEVTVSPQEKYASFVELGTAPHTIQPSTKKALFWPTASHPVRLVHHPGTRANPFMRRARDLALPEVMAIFKQMADIITKQLAG